MGFFDAIIAAQHMNDDKSKNEDLKDDSYYKNLGLNDEEIDLIKNDGWDEYSFEDDEDAEHEDDDYYGEDYDDQDDEDDEWV